jgi:hypothetical protein
MLRAKVAAKKRENVLGEVAGGHLNKSFPQRKNERLAELSDKWSASIASMPFTIQNVYEDRTVSWL